MKSCYRIFFLFFSLICFGQQKQFNIQWEGVKTLETEYGKMEVPAFDAKHFNYDDAKGLRYFTQWDSNGGQINEDSVSLINVSYQTISASELKNLKTKLIPEGLQYKLFNTNARGELGHYFEMSPIIKDRGTYKKVTSFSIEYNYTTSANRGITSARDENDIVNSVLSTGQWYRFYIDKSGVFQLTKSFLNSLGVNTNGVDPRTIKIYGNGGRMLPLRNSENYPFDVVENAVKFVGEEDGSFDSGDYILFYGEGPTTYSQESETNLNLYSDKTFYYVNDLARLFNFYCIYDLIKQSSTSIY